MLVFYAYFTIKNDQAQVPGSRNLQVPPVSEVAIQIDPVSDWQQKFELKSAESNEVSIINESLMTTLNMMETEMQTMVIWAINFARGIQNWVVFGHI